MDDITAWSWAVKGLGGITTILERLAEDGVRCSPHWRDQMQQYLSRLASVLSVLHARTERGEG